MYFGVFEMWHRTFFIQLNYWVRTCDVHTDNRIIQFYNNTVEITVRRPNGPNLRPNDQITLIIDYIWSLVASHTFQQKLILKN